MTAAVLPSLVAAISWSLEFGALSSSLKNAVVTPLIKKITLDAEDSSNYCPVSNLTSSWRGNNNYNRGCLATGSRVDRLNRI